MLNLAIPKYYDINKIWKQVGDKTELPSFEPTNTYTYSTRFLRPTDHLRLKNFTIGFTAPKHWTQKIGVNTLRLYAAGNNLLTWKDKDARRRPRAAWLRSLRHASPAHRHLRSSGRYLVYC